MPAFVLVHSPLVGPASWRPVARVLEGRGHRVVVPSLLDAASQPPFTERCLDAVADAVAGARWADQALVLAGHSGAGPLLPALVARLRSAGRPVAACLFVDAALPHPGRSRLASVHPSFRGRLAGLAHDGVLPPWSEWFERRVIDALVPEPAPRGQLLAELRPVPVALLEEPLPEVPGWPDVPCAYLRLSRAYDGEEADAARMGWPVGALDDNHLLTVVDPEGVADALLDLLGRVGVVDGER